MNIMSEIWRNYDGNSAAALRRGQKAENRPSSRYRLISGEFSLFRETNHSAVKYIIIPM